MILNPLNLTLSKPPHRIVSGQTMDMHGHDYSKTCKEYLVAESGPHDRIAHSFNVSLQAGAATLLYSLSTKHAFLCQVVSPKDVSG